MGRPLELAYDWRLPVGVSTIGVIACVALLAWSRPVGWLSAAVIVVCGFAAFLVVVWVRTQAYLVADGAVLTVRTFRALHRIEGPRLVKVTQVLTRRGPSYQLMVRADDGRLVRRRAPTALLRRGHSTLFDWILAWAPQAELDKGSRRTLQTLRGRGALSQPDDFDPEQTNSEQTNSEQTNRE